MKKIAVTMIVAAVLTLSAAIYVQAQKGEHLFNDYLGFVHQTMMEKHEQAMHTLIKERQQSVEIHEKQLKHFYLDKLSGAKRNMEQHQKDYLLQLEETKEALKNKDFKEFEERKAEELQNEMKQDAEKYLEEILSGK